MPAQVWSGAGPALFDTSAWTRARSDVRARELLLAAIHRGEACWCWAVRFELTLDARNSEEIATLDHTLEALREIPVDRTVQRSVIATMRQLAASGSHGAHRFPLTDLTVAVAAQEASVELVHFDRHLERLGEHLGVAAHWISDPAS